MTTIVIIALTALIVAETAALIALALQNASLKKKLADPTAPIETPTAPTETPTAPTETPQSPPTAPTESPQSPDDTLHRFLDLDRLIDKDKLFLNPDFGRDDLCHLANMNKDRVGQLIKKHSGTTNSQTYINRKRITYAIALMREHPNYTMEAIATECGIGNLSTFYRVFKQMYNTSPSEYRQNMEFL